MCDKVKLIEILKPDFVFEDERGTLTQITHQQFAQTNAVFSHKGQVRGGYHYHNTTKEIFYIISGRVKVLLKLDDITEEYTFKSGDMFLINERVKHCFVYEDDTYLVVFYTNRVESENGEKDIIAD